MNHLDYRQALDALEQSNAPAILSASFDLRPGASGRETATTILREAVRANPLAFERTEQAVDDLVTELTQDLGDAVGSGVDGLFVAGPLDDPTRLRMAGVVAPRHALDVGPRAA